MSGENQNNLYSPILAEIRKALAESKITQVQIGDALGVKQSAVSSLLSGKSRMSLEQFLSLAELAGLRPQNILQQAQNSTAEVLLMTPEMEEAMYKSELHLMAYCAAVREIGPSDLDMAGVTPAAIQHALDELVKVGLLTKKRTKYVQKNPQITYRSSSRLRGSRAHQRVVVRSWDLFDRNIQNKAFISTKFNAYILDRFTTPQTKEIESLLWKVYERVQSFRQSNQATGYVADENMPLWNLHLMLTVPLEK